MSTAGSVTMPTAGSVTMPTAGSVTMPTAGSVTMPTAGSVTVLITKTQGYLLLAKESEQPLYRKILKLTICIAILQVQQLV